MEGSALPRESEVMALERLDEQSKNAQKDGNFLQALEYMERGLVLRQHLYGPESEIVWTACKAAGEICNLLAMTYLQQDDFTLVLELLKKAEILTERDAAGRAATYNNFACYYRRKGKLHAALQFLEKSLKIESKLIYVQNPADTHINACAVLSQLGRHQSALEHAQTALILLQKELLSPLRNENGPEGGQLQPPQPDRIAVLAIAYHNIGVEEEFLKQFEMSVISYQKGVEVAERYLGATHPITSTLLTSLKAAKKSAAQAAKESILNKKASSPSKTVLPKLGRTNSNNNNNAGNSNNKSSEKLYEIF